MVAGFRWQKDQDTLIRSLKYLPSEFHLFLVGEGVRRPLLEALVNTEHLNDRVHFMNLRTDVANLLHAADYVVMSSHWEGFGLSAVEGMAASKPVIAADVDGLREVVAGAGILFPPGDPRTLAKQMLRLDSSPDIYTAVADACRQRADKYDIARMADGYVELYNKLTK